MIALRMLAGSDSFEELTELLHRSYARLAAMGLRYHATWQDAETTRRRAAAGECWVGERGGRLVATVVFHDAARTSGCPWYDRPDVASFHQLAVDPDVQGCGIGGRLLDLVERRAAETGAAEIALDTAEGAQHLIEMYARRGYRFVEHVRWDITNYRSVIMSKRVSEVP